MRHCPSASFTYSSWTSVTDTGRVSFSGASPSRAQSVSIETPRARLGDSIVRRRLLCAWRDSRGPRAARFTYDSAIAARPALRPVATEYTPSSVNRSATPSPFWWSTRYQNSTQSASISARIRRSSSVIGRDSARESRTRAVRAQRARRRAGSLRRRRGRTAPAPWPRSAWATRSRRERATRQG